MKKNLLIAVLLSILSLAARAQVCIPDGSLQPGQISPDTASGQNFVDGNINQYYEDVYSVAVPDSFTVFTYTVGLVQIKYLGVTGLPHGITAQANAADSIWLINTSGCVKLSGTPDTAGTFPVTIQQEVTVNLLGTPYTVPLNNNNYSITIIGGAGMDDYSHNGFDVFTDFNSMSPDNVSFSIKNNSSNDFELQIYSISGQQVYSSKRHLTEGLFTIAVDKHLNPGIYSVRVDSDKKSVTRKIIVM